MPKGRPTSHKYDSATVQADLSALMDWLRPYGVTRPAHVAKLIHDPSEPGYPSEKLVRQVLLGEATATDRFCECFYIMHQYVREVLSTDGAELLAILHERGAVRRPVDYDPAERIRFVYVPPGTPIDFLPLDKLDGPIRFGVVPENLRHLCEYSQCRRPFIGAPNARYDTTKCKRLAAKERQRAKASA